MDKVVIDEDKIRKEMVKGYFFYHIVDRDKFKIKLIPRTI